MVGKRMTKKGGIYDVTLFFACNICSLLQVSIQYGITPAYRGTAIFFAAATRTRIVAADLRHDVGHRLRLGSSLLAVGASNSSGATARIEISMLVMHVFQMRLRQLRFGRVDFFTA